MKHLTVRDLPADLARALDEEKRRRGTSLNQTVKELLMAALGVRQRVDNGLRQFGGDWDDAEADEFDSAVSGFDRVDHETWR